MISNVGDASKSNSNKDKCLTLTRNQIDFATDPPFEISHGSCGNKHHAMCKINQPSQETAVTPPPKFPCLTKSRKKRKIDYGMSINIQ